MKKMCLAGKTYSSRSPFIIAEIGTSHGGDPVKARRIIDTAASSGADCVKFQHVYADEIVHPLTGTIRLPSGLVRIYDRFKALELPPDFFEAMKDYAESKDLFFLCTPFGLRSARELRSIGVQAMKIASPELNFGRLLSEIASYELPTFVSTGVSTLSDIERALAQFFSAFFAPSKDETRSISLLHCVTSYPAPVTDYNLRLLQSLSCVFDIPCGVSDHSMDPVIVPTLSLAMGACVIEKHICLSRSDPGLDDPIALPPADFEIMVRQLREAACMEPDAIVEMLSDRIGAVTVQAVLGDGVKRLAPSEAANYTRTNRSLHVINAIKAGDKFSTSNIAELRTEKELRPGLDPCFFELILGRVACADIPAGEGLRWEDVGGLSGT